jgi:hypothetical protein
MSNHIDMIVQSNVKLSDLLRDLKNIATKIEKE